MALEILLATRNQKKKLELQELLDNPGIRILTLEDIDHIPEIIEDGCTFEENAVKKARETAALSGYTCLAAITSELRSPLPIIAFNPRSIKNGV